MITEATLKNSIFDNSLFSEHDDEITIIEIENKVKEGKLLRVTFRLPHSVFISISTNFLKYTRNVFCKNDEADFSMKMMCDGMFLLNKDGKGYFIVCELKSQYDDVAIRQIMASYVKCKAMLMTMSSYHPGEYEEIGVIVSFPIADDDKHHVYGTDMRNWKGGQNLISQGDSITNITMELKTSGKALVTTSNVGIDKMDLAHCLKGGLTLYHVDVEANHSETEIDLGAILPA